MFKIDEKLIYYKEYNNDDETFNKPSIDNMEISNKPSIDNNDNSIDNKDNSIDNKEIYNKPSIDNNDNSIDNKDNSIDNKDNSIDNNDNSIDNKEISNKLLIDNNKPSITNNDILFINRKNNRDNKKMITNTDDESPKFELSKDDIFIDIPIISTKDEVSADLVNIQIDNNKYTDNYNDKADKLLNLIKENKKKITNNLYIISCKYDIIYYRYNSISLSLLIISTIITFIEAIRLTIINYDTQFKGSEISKYISQDTISLIINCLSLSLSTILTILSSIARFKNYKENMDKLKVIHDTLFNYKNLYDKEKDLIHYYKINNELNLEVFKKIQETIEDYNKEIKSINIFDNIRNTDIIKFNNIKVNHDLRLHQLASKREIELLRINKITNKKKEDINKNSIGCCGFN